MLEVASLVADSSLLSGNLYTCRFASLRTFLFASKLSLQDSEMLQRTLIELWIRNLSSIRENSEVLDANVDSDGSLWQDLDFRSRLHSVFDYNCTPVISAFVSRHGQCAEFV